jgi:hypothetical protein
MEKRQFFILLNLFLILYTLPSQAYGQQTGELVEIQFPYSISAGEQLSVTMTVTNTGLGTWNNVCAYVGYVMADVPVLNLCPNLGLLEPGDSAMYTCSIPSGIPGTPERIWAGIGSPFG